MTSRKRLTVTLKKDLLGKIDDFIDGVKIRNRSHAIEYLLQTALPSPVSKALVLAGGPGLNMRPFTYELPKCLIPVNGRPILEHILENLRQGGIHDIILLAGPHADRLRSHFGDGAHFGVKIHYLEESKKSGTAIPILKAQELLGNSPFLLYYGDVLAEINLKDMIEFYESQEKNITTMAVTSVDMSGDWGVVGLQGNRVVEYTEKPGKGAGSNLINAGIFVMSPEIFKYIPDKKFSMLEKDVIPRLVEESKMTGYSFSGKWFDITTPKTYEKAIKEWKR
jgi:NDP-sugar pyrophosphorylase family protein